MDRPKISVVVPAYNEENYIRECLTSIQHQTLPASEIIVIDNVSTDQTAQIAYDHGAKVIYEPRKGNIFAVMTGMHASQGEIIAFTDADSRVPEDWLAQINKTFAENPDLDALGGVYSFYDGGFLQDIFAQIAQKLIIELVGLNMAIRKKSMDKIVGLDEFTGFGTDIAISRSIKAHGKLFIDRDNVVETSARRFNHSFIPTIGKYLANYASLRLIDTSTVHFPDIREPKPNQH